MAGAASGWGEAVTKAELARIFGVSANSVGKWMDRGCPHEREGRSIKFYTVEVMIWVYGQRPTLEVVNERENREAVEEGDEEKEYFDPEQERARKDHELADKTALENQVRRGELVETEAVWKVFSDVIAAAKVKFLALGAKLAPLVAPESKPAKCKKVIDQATRAICIEMMKNAEKKDGGT